MSKRLCKFDRYEIASQMGTIVQLVAMPKYICRSCTRVAADNKSLCKPMVLPRAVQPDEQNDNLAKQAKKAQKKQQKLTKKLDKLANKQRKLQKKLNELSQK